MVVTNGNEKLETLQLHAKKPGSRAGSGNIERLSLWTLNDFLTTTLPETNDGPLANLYPNLETLSAAAQIEAKSRIRRLIDLTKQTHADAEEDDRESAMQSVNAELGRYTATPTLVFNPNDSFPVLWPEPIKGFFSVNMPHTREIRAAWDVVSLATSGLLFQLETCPCGKLFRPVRAGQKNCSTACSKRQYSKTDKFREQRRLYMRDRYRTTSRGVELEHHKQAPSALADLLPAEPRQRRAPLKPASSPAHLKRLQPA